MKSRLSGGSRAITAKTPYWAYFSLFNQWSPQHGRVRRWTAAPTAAWLTRCWKRTAMHRTAFHLH